MPLHFPTDMESHLIIKNAPCRQVIVLNPGYILTTEFVFYGQTCWNVSSFESPCLHIILEMVVCSRCY